MPYIAWIDILGAESLIFDPKHREEAKRLLADFETTVGEVLTQSGYEFRVFGVNDGIYLLGDDLNRVCGVSMSLFQRWFDQHCDCLNKRPLLRGAITSLGELRTTATQKPVEYWAFATGLGVAYKTEQFLKGSRLFVDHTLPESSLPLNFSFTWNELSQSFLRENPEQPLRELFWPTYGDPNGYLKRLQRVHHIYDTALEQWGSDMKQYLTPNRNGQHEVSVKKYMQYEETLKLSIRSAGKFAADSSRTKSEKDELFKYIETFINYRPDFIPYTWGLCFAALWACFAANLNLGIIFDAAYNFLNVSDGKGLVDFKKELREKTTYRPFRDWLLARDTTHDWA
jgi:hypothetical protein